MHFKFTDPRTNWKYVAIVVVFGMVVGGGAWWYGNSLKTEPQLPSTPFVTPTQNDQPTLASTVVCEEEVYRLEAGTNSFPEYKPLGPLNVGLAIVEPRFSLGDTITVVLDFGIAEGIPQPNVSKANVTFQTSAEEVSQINPLEILMGKSCVVDPISVGQRYAIKVPIKINSTGKGVFITNVVAVDSTGKSVFGRRADLYFLVFPDEILVGKGSFIELEIRKLQQDLQIGRISEEQYRKGIEELITGRGITH